MILCLSWQTDVMPVQAHWYYHVSCYLEGFPEFNKPKVDNAHLDIIEAYEVSERTCCAGCQKPFAVQVGVITALEARIEKMQTV